MSENEVQAAETTEVKEKKGMLTKIKEKVSAGAHWVWDHKKTIAGLAGAAAAGAAVASFFTGGGSLEDLTAMGSGDSDAEDYEAAMTTAAEMDAEA